MNGGHTVFPQICGSGDGTAQPIKSKTAPLSEVLFFLEAVLYVIRRRYSVCQCSLFEQ